MKTMTELLAILAEVGNRLDTVDLAAEPARARALLRARRQIRASIEAQRVLTES